MAASRMETSINNEAGVCTPNMYALSKVSMDSTSPQENSENCSCALCWACETNSIDDVKMLIKQGASINIIDNFGRKPLFLACQKGFAEIVEVLLDCGGNANEANYKTYANDTNELSLTRLFRTCIYEA